MRRASPFVEALTGVALVAAAMVLVVTVFATRAANQPSPMPKTNRITSFDEQWRMAGLSVEMVPTRVQTERIVPNIEQTIKPEVIVPGATVAQKAEEAVPEEAAKPRRNIRRTTRDICRGKGRITTKNGKSWKCRR